MATLGFLQTLSSNQGPEVWSHKRVCILALPPAILPSTRSWTRFEYVNIKQDNTDETMYSIAQQITVLLL